MTLDVTWDGVVLAKGAQAREQDGGWFVELEQPMPVGTVLQVAGDTQATVRVARVHEGLGAGMLLKKNVDSPQSTVDSQKPEPEKPESKAEAETPEVENGKKERRKKPPRKG